LTSTNLDVCTSARAVPPADSLFATLMPVPAWINAVSMWPRFVQVNSPARQRRTPASRPGVPVLFRAPTLKCGSVPMCVHAWL